MATALRLSHMSGEAPDPDDTSSMREGEWLIHVKAGLRAQHLIARPPSPSGWIYSVPSILIDLKRDAYLPQVLSVGPSYHGNRQLSEMDCHKLRAAQRMVQRLPGGTSTDINFVVAEIEKLDGEIRGCYYKFIDCNSETLAWMMLLDASFLLELLRTLAGKNHCDSSDCLYFDEKRIKSVGFGALMDIVKLENQIPLFVLEKILQLEARTEKEAQSRLFHLLLEAALTFFPFKHTQLSRFKPDSLSNIGREHFLAFLHGLTLCFFSGAKASSSSSIAETQSNDVLPSASRLRKAGIWIRPYAGDGGMALGFDKEASTLYLPVIMISENTETVLRNLMAMETFLPPELQVISCYVGLMDSLIYREQDATLLRTAGIFNIYVGNDAQVAQLWDSLCRGVAISSLQSLKTLKSEIIECYRSKWTARLLEFVFTRFIRPWRTTISVIAATLVFLFTFTQAMSSLYVFYKGTP